MTSLSIPIRLKRGTVANWTSVNPILLLAEPGLEIDTNLLKIGDGITEWNNLDYFGDLALFTTDSLSEGLTNLYYTEARVDTNIALKSGAANGIAPLDGSSKIASTYLPAIALTDTFVVASQAAQTALVAETGDVAVRTDENKSYILAGTDPTIFADWQELLTPTDTVLSVNGQTGIVSLVKADVGLGNVDNTSDVNKPVSTDQQNAIDAKVADAINNGTTTIAPSQNAVFDALALKEDAANVAADAKAAAVANSITDGITDVAPSQNAVFDALALKQPLDAQLTDVAALAYAGNALKVVRVNAGATAFELATGGAGATNIDGLTDGISNNADSVYLGTLAGAALTTGTDDTACGVQALQSLTSGAQNTAVGYIASRSMTTSTNTTAVGRAALRNTTGNQATSIGANGLGATAGAHTDCTSVGYAALAGNSTGTQNTAVGSSSLDANTSGFDNTAVGFNALGGNTTGSDNTAVGAQALAAITSSRNVAIGSAALAGAAAADNTAIGYNALLGSTAANNTAVGARALDANTNGGQNVAIGRDALGANTTASNGVAVGEAALFSNTTGTDNTAIGQAALRTNTIGVQNVAVGFEALKNSTTAGQNVAVGWQALKTNTTAVQNVAVGNQTLLNLTTGEQNTVVGMGSCAGVTTGGHNTGIGWNISGLTTGSGNTLLGDSVTVDAGAAINRTVIGKDAVGLTNNAAQIGATTMVSARFGDGTAILYADGSALTNLPVVRDESEDGAISGTGVTVVEYGDPGSHKTVLTFVNTPVPLTDLATLGAIGGLKVYDFGASYTGFAAVSLLGTVTKSSAGVDDDADFIIELAGEVVEEADVDGTGNSTVTPTQIYSPGLQTLTAGSLAVDMVQYGGISTAVNISATELWLNFAVAETDEDVGVTPANMIFNGTITINWIKL